MNEFESSGEPSRALDVTKAGSLTLHEHGISFAVDGNGQVLRYIDGTPIPGELIEDMVNRSGQRLTNAQAATQIIATQQFVASVEESISELRALGEEQ